MRIKRKPLSLQFRSGSWTLRGSFHWVVRNERGESTSLIGKWKGGKVWDCVNVRKGFVFIFNVQDMGRCWKHPVWNVSNTIHKEGESGMQGNGG